MPMCDFNKVAKQLHIFRTQFPKNTSEGLLLFSQFLLNFAHSFWFFINDRMTIGIIGFRFRGNVKQHKTLFGFMFIFLENGNLPAFCSKVTISNDFSSKSFCHFKLTRQKLGLGEREGNCIFCHVWLVRFPITNSVLFIPMQLPFSSFPSSFLNSLWYDVFFCLLYTNLGLPKKSKKHFVNVYLWYIRFLVFFSSVFGNF